MQKKRLIFIALLVVLIILILSLSQCRRARDDFSYALKDIPQDTKAYLPANAANQTLLSPTQQQIAAKEYLARYFAPWSANPLAYSPWGGNQAVTLNAILAKGKEDIEAFKDKPGWGENHLPYPADYFKPVIANMAMDTFPNRNQRAITIRSANLRVLPTTDPSFANLNNAGEGYPFDYLQESRLPANTPVLILQTTKDGAWDLVLFYYGADWIKAENVATVDENFMKEWQTGNYVTPLKDNIPLHDQQGLFRFMAKIGTIYPLKSGGTNILIAVPDADQGAVIKTANATADFTPWPMPANTTNSTTLLNKLLGVYYGWGEEKGYRDCSATAMNYFAALGIWLPRSSGDQASVGKYIPFDNMSNKEKQAEILKSGIPWLTLLKLPGHIVLYIGQKDNTQYIFHDFWGLHTRKLFGGEGRAIVGKTAITPIDFGQGYINVPQTVLDRIEGMVIIPSPQS